MDANQLKKFIRGTFMRKSRSTLMASTGLIAAVLAFPTFALSQTADAPVDGTEVEEVVVMARGRVEQLKDVAVSASVTSGAVICELKD